MNEIPRGTKEACDLITKTSIIGMFHDGHQLDGIVALLFDPWQNFCSEVIIGGDLFFWRADANVALVDLQVVWSLWTFAFKLKCLI